MFILDRSNIVAEATSNLGAAVTYTSPTANDAVDGVVAVSCTPASGSTFALDKITDVTCTATDLHKNPTTGGFTVQVSDTTPPALTLPSTITAKATGAAGATVTY